jgi:quercetin dioxygenase-like cupin family protein
MTKLSTLAISAIALAGAAGFSSSAFAGSCPADQMKTNARPSGETMPKDVTDTELSSIELGEQIQGFDGRKLRLRRLVIQPGGIVPWHSHDDRPALIMTVSGTVTEYASNCAVGIVHRPGEVAREVKGVSHWWKNTGSTEAVLLAADVMNTAGAASGGH